MNATATAHRSAGQAWIMNMGHSRRPLRQGMEIRIAQEEYTILSVNRSGAIAKPKAGGPTIQISTEAEVQILISRPNGHRADPDLPQPLIVSSDSLEENRHQPQKEEVALMPSITSTRQETHEDRLARIALEQEEQDRQDIRDAFEISKRSLERAGWNVDTTRLISSSSLQEPDPPPSSYFGLDTEPPDDQDLTLPGAPGPQTEGETPGPELTDSTQEDTPMPLDPDQTSADLPDHAAREEPPAAPLYSLADMETLTGLSYVTLTRYAQAYPDRIPHVGEGRSRRYPPEAIEVFKQISQEKVEARKGPRGPKSTPPPPARHIEEERRKEAEMKGQKEQKSGEAGKKSKGVRANLKGPRRGHHKSPIRSIHPTGTGTGGNNLASSSPGFSSTSGLPSLPLLSAAATRAMDDAISAMEKAQDVTRLELLEQILEPLERERERLRKSLGLGHEGRKG